MARVLLLEPDRRIRAFIAGILADFGHDVQECNNGAEARAQLAGAPFDVLTTDRAWHDAPDEVLAKNAIARRIPTLTLTGRRFRTAQAGGDLPARLGEKPFRFADLQALLDALAAYPAARPTPPA